MKHLNLSVCVLLTVVGLSEASARDAGNAKGIDVRRAIDVALAALEDQPARWLTRRGFEARVSSEQGDWTIVFLPVGGPMGSQVSVAVKSDGNTTVVPPIRTLPDRALGTMRVVDFRRATGLALGALKDQPSSWAMAGGFNVRVQIEGNEWSILFDPAGAALGNHVLVRVKGDWTTAVVTGM